MTKQVSNPPGQKTFNATIKNYNQSELQVIMTDCIMGKCCNKEQQRSGCGYSVCSRPCFNTLPKETNCITAEELLMSGG